MLTSFLPPKLNPTIGPYFLCIRSKPAVASLPMANRGSPMNGTKCRGPGGKFFGYCFEWMNQYSPKITIPNKIKAHILNCLTRNYCFLRQSKVIVFISTKLKEWLDNQQLCEVWLCKLHANKNALPRFGQTRDRVISSNSGFEVVRTYRHPCFKIWMYRHKIFDILLRLKRGVISRWPPTSCVNYSLKMKRNKMEANHCDQFGTMFFVQLSKWIKNWKMVQNIPILSVQSTYTIKIKAPHVRLFSIRSFLCLYLLKCYIDWGCDKWGHLMDTQDCLVSREVSEVTLVKQGRQLNANVPYLILYVISLSNHNILW